MLEALLVGSGGLYLPNSGPGTKILKYGNEDLGFFGEVTSVELFSTDELSNEVGFTDGQINESFPTWLKFAYKGKVLFIAKQPLRYNVTWNQLYTAGLVYGEEGVGPLADSIEQNDTDQLKLVSKDEYLLKVRLLKDAPTPVLNAMNSAVDTDFERDSEWVQLIYRISDSISKLPDAPISVWENYTDAEIAVGSGNGHRAWIQEHREDNLSYAWVRGYNTIQTFISYTKTSSGTSLGWRPVLELITDNPLFRQGQHRYETTAGLRIVEGIKAKLPTNAKSLYTATPVVEIISDEEAGQVLLRHNNLEYIIPGNLRLLSNPVIYGSPEHMDSIPYGLFARPLQDGVLIRQNDLIQANIGIGKNGNLKGRPHLNALIPLGDYAISVHAE